jgi:hypothetical protein
MFDPAPLPPSTTDLRAWVRYYALPVTARRVIIPDQDAPARAKVLDISRAGAALLLDRPVEAGVFLIAELEGADQASTREVLMEAVYVA